MKNKIIKNKNLIYNSLKIITNPRFLNIDQETQKVIIMNFVKHLSKEISDIEIDLDLNSYGTFDYETKIMSINPNLIDEKLENLSPEKQARFKIYNLLNSILHETEHSLQLEKQEFQHNLQNIISNADMAPYQQIEQDAYSTTFHCLDVLAEQFPELFDDLDEFKNYTNNERNTYYENKQNLISTLKKNKYGTLENGLKLIEKFEKQIHQHFDKSHLDRKNEALYKNLQFNINNNTVAYDIEKTKDEWNVRVEVESDVTKKSFIKKQPMGYKDFLYKINVNLFGNTVIIQPGGFKNNSALSYLENDEIAKLAISKLISNYQRAEQCIIENIIYSPIDLSINKKEYQKAIIRNAKYICPNVEINKNDDISIHTIENIPLKDNEINIQINECALMKTKEKLIDYLYNCTTDDISYIISNKEKFDILQKDIIKTLIIDCIQNNKNIFINDDEKEINKKLLNTFKNINLEKIQRKRIIKTNEEIDNIVNRMLYNTQNKEDDKLNDIINDFRNEVVQDTLENTNVDINNER